MTVAYFKYLSWQFTGSTEENHDTSEPLYMITGFEPRNFFTEGWEISVHNH